MELELYLMEAEERMEKAHASYKLNLTKISAGRANPKILDSIKVDYYSTLTPLNQVAMISVPEPRQLLIKPYEQDMTKIIVGVINSSSLGVNAVDEGEKARITFPEVTTQRRKDLVKSLASYTEGAKIAVRQARQDVNKDIKKDEELSEDEQRSYLEAVQKLTDKYVAEVDGTTKEKEKDLMAM